MKITKAQLRKMIQEEVQSIKETWNTKPVMGSSTRQEIADEKSKEDAAKEFLKKKGPNVDWKSDSDLERFWQEIAARMEGQR
jgi:hypothetical protein